MAKTLWTLGSSECNRVKFLFSVHYITRAMGIFVFRAVHQFDRFSDGPAV